MIVTSTRSAEARDALLDALLLKETVSEFFRAESDLLDNRDFSAWLDLFADDATYLIPLQRNVKFDQQHRAVGLGRRDVAWAADSKDTLAQRVQQLNTGVHWADEPGSRYTHIVTNIGIVDRDVDADCVATRSRFILYRNRGQTETDLFIGIREDVLRRHGETWLIKDRLVLLQQSVLLSKNLSMFF